MLVSKTEMDKRCELVASREVVRKETQTVPEADDAGQQILNINRV